MGDSVRQEVAIREARDRVVQGAPLGRLEQVRVVEGDRSELGEPAEGADLARPERPLETARREPDHADDAPAGRQRNPDHGTEHEGGHVACALGPGVVVVDGDRASLAVDDAGQPAVGRHPVIEEIGEQPDPVADHQRPAVGLEQVDVAVRGAEQRRRPADDRLEKVVRVVPVHERDRGFVERGKVWIATGDLGVLRSHRGLGEVERLVRGGHELGLGQSVVGITGDTGRDGDPRPGR